MKNLLAFKNENKYNSLFFSIVLLILAPPFLYKLPILSYLIFVFVSLVIINCLLIIYGKPKNSRIALITGVLVLGFAWLNFLVKSDFFVLDLITNGLLVVIFAVTFRSILLEIFKLKKVSAHVVVGAISAYLLLGLMGAFLFDVIEILYPGSFSASKLYTGFYAEIYFSFVTLSTLGYGDISPITPQGQATAIFVSISGQLYLAILMAMLVGKFLKDSDW